MMWGTLRVFEATSRLMEILLLSPILRLWRSWRVILLLGGLTDGSLVDLASIFSVLTEVQGNLIIQNNANVATITGFVALREVDGNVSIGGAGTNEGNAALTAAPALEALTTIGGNLVIA